MAVVYVLASDGTPLMPTKRFGHVRILLKTKRATVYSTKPFCIKLCYETVKKTQPVIVGINPGRTNIGICAVDMNGIPLMSAHLETRNKEIPKLMTKRKTFRQGHRRNKRRLKRIRRAKRANTCVTKRQIERKLPGCKELVVCKHIRNKKARFNNRLRPAGWLTPTARHLLQTHLNLIKKAGKHLPVTDVVIEINKFAFAKLENPNIRGKEYCHGPLYQTGGLHEAVSAQQNGKCLLCRKRSIEHYHHIVPRSKRGSDTIGNIAGLCKECHKKVHTDAKAYEKLKSRKAGLNKKHDALSVLNQICPHLFRELQRIYTPERVHLSHGYDTKKMRNANNANKNHNIDAQCVALSVLDGASFIRPDAVYELKQFRRHDRQACHQENINRRYKLDDKVVAINRHKAFANDVQKQSEPSLEEYVASGGDTSRLTVVSHPKTYKRVDRIMPGAMFLVDGVAKIMVASRGLHNGMPDYYRFADGSRSTPKHCKLTKQNIGIVFV